MITEPTLSDWITGKAYQKLVERSSDVQEAKAFAENLKPNKDSNYAWILETALKESESVGDAVDGMDAKADALIRYIGAAEGVLSLATVYVATKPENAAFLLVSGPTLVAFLFAIVVAVVVRAPAYHPGFPSARDAFECEQENKGQAVFAAEIMMRSRAARVIVDTKGTLTRFSYLIFLIGVAWFVTGSILFAFFQAPFPQFNYVR